MSSVEQILPSQPSGRVFTDSIGSIKSSAMRFLSGTALSRVTGMLRDIVLAFCFGTHEALAALFVAFRLSHVCRRLFGEGALQSAFIPVFEDLRREAPERAFRFFRDVSYLLALFLVGFVALSMATLGLSLTLVDWSEANREIIRLMMMLMPSLFFICLFGLNISLLQCQKRYFTAGIAPAFFNITIVAGSFLCAHLDPRRAMPYVAISIVLGCLAQWSVTFLPAWRHVRAVLVRIREQIALLSPDVRRLAAPLSLGLLGVGASQINNAVDALFARYADPEGPAQLWYALRLLQLPLALFGIAISGALLPPLSRSFQSGRREEYVRFLEFALRRVFALLLPCTVGLYLFGTPLVNGIYGHGDFQAHSIAMTTGCLWGYAFGLIPMGLIIVLAPAFYATKDFTTPARGACLSLALNLVLNALMIFPLAFGALSVAAATSIASWVNVAYLFRHLARRISPLISHEGQKQCLKTVIATCIAGALTWVLQFQYFWASELPAQLTDKCLALVVPGTFFLVALFCIARLQHASDLVGLLRLPGPDTSEEAPCATP